MVGESNCHCNHVKYQVSLTHTGRRPLQRDTQDIQDDDNIVCIWHNDTGNFLTWGCSKIKFKAKIKSKQFSEFGSHTICVLVTEILRQIDGFISFSLFAGMFRC